MQRKIQRRLRGTETRRCCAIVVFTDYTLNQITQFIFTSTSAGYKSQRGDKSRKPSRKAMAVRYGTVFGAIPTADQPLRRAVAQAGGVLSLSPNDSLASLLYRGLNHSAEPRYP
jgi:hypothetical protein